MFSQILWRNYLGKWSTRLAPFLKNKKIFQSKLQNKNNDQECDAWLGSGRAAASFCHVVLSSWQASAALTCTAGYEKWRLSNWLTAVCLDLHVYRSCFLQKCTLKTIGHGSCPAACLQLFQFNLLLVSTCMGVRVWLKQKIEGKKIGLKKCLLYLLSKLVQADNFQVFIYLSMW